MSTSLTSTSRSEELYSSAVTKMPGGVNSPVRAFKAVSGTPLFIDHAKGAHIFDADGNEYVDYVSSWGAIIHGHANPAINAAIQKSAEKGTSFGAPHEGEVKLAEAVIARMPGVEMVRFVNSGTEASMAAIRLARAVTSRSKIIKFEGHYHGAVDSLLSKSGSGVATLCVPDSAGVPKEAAQDTLTAPYNNLAAVAEIFEKHGSSIAAIIVEPVAGNMGVVLPQSGFIQGLKELAHRHGSLLIIDEVMTGFRVSPGGASQLLEVTGDLVVMGKVIGGGLPVGAYGGKREYMEWIAPVGPVYQAGTLSGNPLAMAAGLAALDQLNPSVYEKLESLGGSLESGLKRAASDLGVPVQVNRCGSMISVFFCDHPVTNFGEAQTTNRERFGKLFHGMLHQGIYLPPSALEAWFLNASHSQQDIDRTIEAFGKALRS